MKVRKLAVALALAGGLGSGMANALGLGEIELQSWLNEPLDAEISLRQSQGINPNDLFVNVAPEAAYERVGLDRNQFLSKLRFEVVTGPDGGLMINVSSREPLREPYLNFLLELTWPNGRLMREYAVLVDPPVYAEESGVDEQIAAPQSSQPREDVGAERSAESRRRQAQAEASLSRSSGTSSDSFGPTGASDTLWSIASQMRPDTSVSMHQVMLAIQDENPNAFMDGNINRLKRGEVLRVPPMELMRSRSRAEADRIVARQNQAFQSPEPVETASTSETEAAQPEQGQATEASAGDSELKLLATDEETANGRDAEDGGSAGGDGDMPGGEDAGSAIASEEMDALRRENEELDSRLRDMQDQVNTLQRLLELKDSQLADLQGMAADGAQATDGGAVPADGGDTEAAGTDTTATDTTAATDTDTTGAGEDQAPQDSVAIKEESSNSKTNVDNAEPAAEAPDVASAEPGEPAQQPAQPEAPAQKPFPGNIIDAIMNNPLYQMALGGGLIVLLLLLLLAKRKRDNKEKEFFNQFADESVEEEGEGSFDIGLEGELDTAPESTRGDALAEADKYLAYGQHAQAAEMLETAISREPSRTDLRLKLLGVYAASQDSESFDKQYNELATLEDDDAIAQADELRAGMDEAEFGPSIDDLESQLRSDTSAEQSEESREDSVTGEFKADEFEASQEGSLENEFGDIASNVAEETDAKEEDMEFDLSLADLEDSEQPRASEQGEEDASIEEPDFDALDFDLESDAETETETETETDKDDELDLTEDWSSLELEESPELGDLESEFEETVSEKPEPAEEEPAEDDLSVTSGALDDSFLDELDAELDKVSDEGEAPSEPKPESESEPDADEADLNNLDMDLSDEDLAIMDELSDDEDIPSLDAEAPVAEEGQSDSQAEERQPSPLDLDESDLGDDDDFDFLAGTDEAATKLDLARAYVEMGDSDGARDILEEVALEGDDEQKAEAQELLKNLS